MKLRPAGPWLFSLLGGLVVSAVGTLIPLFGWALAPGMVLSWSIFPEGVHTASGFRGGSFGAVFLGSAVFWAVALFALIAVCRWLRLGKQDTRNLEP